ncbi:MAG: outer membrane beta-barrel protein [Bacteriovoracaceae bacterium]
MRFSFIVLFLFLFPIVAEASMVEAFVDSYYAYDFNAPSSGKRAFTTQPLYHNQPNINLAYGGFNVSNENWRGRLIIQGGNSVEANTLREKSDLKYLQESYIGRKFGDVWVDGGIYLGHIGAESWISKDNWTYSRALNLDYVPYYSTGFRITYKNFQLHLMNGWQTIRDDNTAKSVGTQYIKKFGEEVTFTLNTFFGDEEQVPGPDGKFRPRFRGYYNFILKFEPGGNWQYLAAVDFGHQSQQANTGVDGWGAATFTARRKLDEKRFIAGRIEHYYDPHKANVIGTKNGFVTSGLSVNFDQYLASTTMWRTEVRGFSSRDEIYPAGKGGLSRMDGFIATSLSLWLP